MVPQKKNRGGTKTERAGMPTAECVTALSNAVVLYELTLASYAQFAESKRKNITTTTGLTSTPNPRGGMGRGSGEGDDFLFEGFSCWGTGQKHRCTRGMHAEAHLVFGRLQALLLRQEGLAQLLNLPLADVRVQLLRGLVAHPVRLEVGQPCLQR